MERTEGPTGTSFVREGEKRGRKGKRTETKGLSLQKKYLAPLLSTKIHNVIDIWIVHAQTVTKLSVGLIPSTLHFQLTVVLLIVGNVQAYYSVISTLISTKLVHTCKLQYHNVAIFFNSALEINNSLTQNCHNYSNNTWIGANIMNSYRLSMGSHSNAYCCVA